MTTSVEETIDRIVKGDDIVLFMKGVPTAPQCGFSGAVVQILSQLAVPYNSVNVLADNEIREGVKTYSQWPTFPQLYVKGELVGGCDIVREMHQSGELVTMLREKRILAV